MRYLLILLLLPVFSFAQLSPHDLIEVYNKRGTPDSSFDFVKEKGYRLVSIRIDSSEYSAYTYGKAETSINFEGEHRVRFIKYRTLDSTEFSSWDRLILKEGFKFQKSYFGEGKWYYKYVGQKDTLFCMSAVEDGMNVFYLLIL